LSQEVGPQRAPLWGARLRGADITRASRIRCHVRSSKICRHRIPSWPPLVLSKPTAPRVTAVTTGPRVHHRRLSGSGASSTLALPALGASASLDPGGAPPPVTRLGVPPPLAPRSSSLARPRKPPPPLARPREPPPPLKPNPWRSGGVFIAARTWCD
jgi:hypothetical protein